MTAVAANPPVAAPGGPNVATQPPAAGAQQQTAPSYPIASLYVGDLHPEVNEAMLFEKFSLAGPVLSIRVCRDAITRRSLGYAYVNYQQPADAERALDTMNFDVIMEKPIRIMWSQRDPSLRRSGLGNIFIKHLDKGIDNKAIHDTFSTFGTILSCKVVYDEKGQSRGYGFVHFDSEKAARTAIEKVNGMLLNGKKVYAGMFEARQQREKKYGESRKFQNVFIKNFKDTMTEDKLREMFGKFGDIESIHISRDQGPDDQPGKVRGFGFVSFKSPDSAEQAVAEMNGSTEMANEGSNDGKLFVGRAQKKAERQAELKRIYEERKNERIQKYQGVNLYVKNLVDEIDDEELEKVFSKFGKISSAKVMRDEVSGRSRGFGFVCFEDPEDATRAVTEMNTKPVRDKPLYVALAQRKDERKSQLAAKYMTRLAQMRIQSAMPGQMYGPGVGGQFIAQHGQFGGQMRAPGGYGAGMPAQMASAQMMAAAAAQRGGMQGGAQQWQQRMAPMPQQQPQQYGMMSQQQQQYAAMQRAQQGMMGAQQQMQAANQQQTRPMAPAQMMGQRTMGPASAQQQRPPAPQQGTQQMRGGQGMQGNMRMMQPAGGAQGYQQVRARQQQQQQDQESLAQLANMPPQEQKQLIGERLFPLVEQASEPGHAGKITGMLLEMDNAELLSMLEDHQMLSQKVREALAALNSSAPR